MIHTSEETGGSAAAALHREHRLVAARDLSATTYVLRLNREGVDFTPGQHLHVGLAGSLDVREYSIYSGGEDDYLEVLIREVTEGTVSKQLRRVGVGDPLRVEGPYGYFTLPGDPREGDYLFVATGSGIAPFRAFTRSYPGISYRLLHGVRSLGDHFEYESFDPERVTLCVSREPVALAPSPFAGFEGRVTDYLRRNPAAPGTKCFLCGNCDMIYEAFDILKRQGVEPNDLYSEVYF